MIYTIYKNNDEFIDFNDAQRDFEFLFCIKDSKGWHIDRQRIYDINSTYDVLCNFKTEINETCRRKILIRHVNYKNILKPYYESKSIDINALQEEGYVEIDLKENNDKTGFKYELTDCKDNLISYAIDDQSESSRLTKYLNSRYKRSELRNFT